jgi:hypothetical protein
MTVKQLLKWRKDVLAEKIKYPPELIDSVVKIVKRDWIDFEENIFKRDKKQ